MNTNRFLDYAIGRLDVSWIQLIDTGIAFGFTFANSPNNYYRTNVGTRAPNPVATPTMPQ